MSRYSGFRTNSIFTDWNSRRSPSAQGAATPSSLLDLDYSKVQGIWSLNSTTQFPKTSSDIYFSNVGLLLRGEGVDNGTTFVDSSSNNFVVSAFGNAKTVTAVKKYGNSSMYFDGTGDYLTVEDNGAFDFNTGDFTVESWIRPGAFSTDNNSIVAGIGATNGDWMLALTSATQLRWGRNQTAWDLASAGVTFAVDTWYHVAVARAGTTLKIFVDGVERASATNSTAYNIANSSLAIGARQLTTNTRGAGNFFTGYIDDLRITKGVARYTANFTPTTTGY